MARIRTIKPDFFRHELLQDLEITHPGACPMLVFAGLWGHCDKAGRFLWRPKHLKLDILPFLPFDMASTLAILQQAGLLKKYNVSGLDYGLIPSFVEHQRIGGKEAQEPEKFPAPSGEAKVKKRGSTGEAAGKQPGLQEGKGREGNGVIDLNTEGFEAIWAIYPRRNGDNPKRKALHAFNARRAEGHDPEEIKAGVERYARWVRSAGKEGTEFVKQAATFLGPEKFFLQPYDIQPKREESPLYRREGAM